jgi:hypothetical protein
MEISVELINVEDILTREGENYAREKTNERFLFNRF